MKLVAVALLVPGMLCTSTLAMAEGPVPFRAYMQAAGAQPAVPPPPHAKDQFTAVSNPPAHTHMTHGGKIMTGAGIGMLAAGGAVFAGAALVSSSGFSPSSSSKKAGLYGGAAGLCAGGVTLIIFGHHRRSAE
jgi:hypothetical protein